MPRRIRVTAGGMVYHVLNRGVGRMRLFRKAADFAAMEQVLEVGGGIGGGALQCGAWPAVWRRSLGAAYGQAIWAGVDISPAGSPSHQAIAMNLAENDFRPICAFRLIIKLVGRVPPA